LHQNHANDHADPFDPRTIHTFILPALQNSSRDIPLNKKAELPPDGAHAANCGNSAVFASYKCLALSKDPWLSVARSRGFSFS